MFSLLFVLLNLLIGLLLFYNFYFKRRKFPPGPAPLPLIGNMLQFRNEMPENCFLRWRRQYGNVFTIWFGELPLVCVTDYAIIMETFQKDGDAYAGRISKELGKILRNGSYGVILTEGELWREQRRFSLHVFRDFGVGKNLMQEKILSELELMYERIDREAEFGNEMDIGELLNIGIGSIINNLLFGYRFDDKRLPEFRKLKCLLRENFVNLFSHYRILFNWNTNVLRRLPFLSRKFEQLKQIEENLSSFFAQQIKVHMKEIDMDDVDAPSQNLVEAFLKEKARRDATGEAHGFTIDQLNELCSDLWMAGQETTSNTLAWGFAYLIHHPDVQAKIQREIDDVIGEAEKEDQDRRQITVADRAAMHYTNATINEIQRAANLVPLNVMHKLTRDVVIDGYRLPKGCAIAPQISAILADGKIFDNPSEFRPERFLDEEGKLKRTDELIPFSVGKRQCLGEPLARMELFLFLANLLNRYRVSIGNALPSLERKLAATVACPEFRCRIEKRCHKAVHE